MITACKTEVSIMLSQPITGSKCQGGKRVVNFLLSHWILHCVKLSAYCFANSNLTHKKGKKFTELSVSGLQLPPKFAYIWLQIAEDLIIMYCVLCQLPSKADHSSWFLIKEFGSHLDESMTTVHSQALYQVTNCQGSRITSVSWFFLNSCLCSVRVWT